MEDLRKGMPTPSIVPLGLRPVVPNATPGASGQGQITPVVQPSSPPGATTPGTGPAAGKN